MKFRIIGIKRLLVGLSLAVLLVLAACGTPTTPPSAPTISRFVPTPATIVEGESSTLNWVVTGNPADVELRIGSTVVEADLEAAGNTTVSPTATTTYTLAASNARGKVTRQVTVTVTPRIDPEVDPPVINSFTATPGTIEEGGSTTLAWVVSGDPTVVELRVDTTIIEAELEADGSTTVSPTATTTYTLAASNAGGEVTEQVTVTVEAGVVPPVIEGFTANPETIVVGGSSTLQWTVTGETTGVELRTGDTVVESGLDAEGSTVVSPPATTTYTLAAVYEGGEVTSNVTVTVTQPGDPMVSNVEVVVVEESQFTVTWTATDATSITVVGVNPADAEDTTPIPGGTLDGNVATATLPIPDADHLLIRVVASNVSGESFRDAAAPLANIVLNTEDYDPFAFDGRVPDEPVNGSLRQVLADAPSGAIIGFAANVVAAGTIDIYGVELFQDLGVGTGTLDSHLHIDRDARVSAPTTGITLNAIPAFGPGDTGDTWLYKSRVLYVASTADVTLDNLEITGGGFIFAGAGIRNAGTLTVNGGAITDSRAWYTGGGIHNQGTATLNGTVLSGNEALTLESEVGAGLNARDNPADPTGPIDEGGWGGAIYNAAGGTMTLIDVTLTDNTALRTGGAISNAVGGTITIEGGALSGNSATDVTVTTRKFGSNGAGLLSGGTLEIDDVLFEDNDARDVGGAIGVMQPGTASIGASTFANNEADYSGAIHVWFCQGGSAADVLTNNVGNSFSGNIARLGDNVAVGESSVVCAPGLGIAGAAWAFPSAEQLEIGGSR